MAEIPPPDKGPLKRMNAGEMRASAGAAEDHFQYFLQAWWASELYTASPTVSQSYNVTTTAVKMSCVCQQV